MDARNEGAGATAVLEPRLSEELDARTILLLDPVMLFLRFEETVLQRKDWRIHSSRTAAHALELLEVEHVDLIVMEHVLPDTAGEDLIRAIRANPRTRATAILVLTARGTEGAVERCLDAGANGVIFKPVTRHDLCSRVEDLLYVAARRHLRTMVRLSVDATHGGGLVFGSSVNVSAGGMLLETSAALSKGDTLDLRFSLPGEAEPIVVRGRVVRLAEATEPGKYAAGLTFEGMTEDDRARIDGFVAAARNQCGVFAPLT